MNGYFSAKEVVALTGVRYRQLAYWVNSGVVRASVDTAGGKRRRLFSFVDVIEVRAVRTFVESGVRLAVIRRTVEHLRVQLSATSQGTLANFRLVTNGKDLFRFESATDTLVKMDGSEQLAFAFDLGTQIRGLVAQIRAKPKRLRYEPRERKAA